MIKLPVAVGTKPDNISGIVDFGDSCCFGEVFDGFDVTHFDMFIVATLLTFGYDSFECVSCVVTNFGIAVGYMTSLISGINLRGVQT